MTSFRDAQGLPVIATRTAEEIGAVDHFVVRDGHVQAIHVGGKRRVAPLLDWSDIGAFGDDAVMIDDGDRLHDPRDGLEARAVDGDLIMVGKRVLREDGDEIGTVTDVDFDRADGTITALTVDDRTVPGGRLCGVGAYAVVITEPPSD